MSTPRQQRKNRLHLAEMLEERINDEQFDMRDFTNPCGTVGCAMGIAVMSGEFGYGWNPNGMISPSPVRDGKRVWWKNAALDVFGREATERVFYNPRLRSRQQVAAELRAIK